MLERIGARERVVAVVDRGHPISRHVEVNCAKDGCQAVTCFDFQGNCSSRFCVEHMVEWRASKKR